MRTLILIVLLGPWCGAFAESQVLPRVKDALAVMSKSLVPGAASPVARGVDDLLADGPLEKIYAPELVKRFTDYLALFGGFNACEDIAVVRYGRVEIAYFTASYSRGVLFMRTVSLIAPSGKFITEFAVDTKPEAVLPTAMLSPAK
jgi:hypothetical protein